MMQRRTIAQVLAMALAQPLTGLAETSAMGSHGMAVFGGKSGLFASHLPMFHAPHDTQMLLRFHLADAGQDALLRKSLTTHPTLWTLAPQSFDLLRFAPGHADPIKQFSAHVFEGHFERHGQERMAAQTVVVDQVLMFRRLNPACRTAQVGRYIVVGADSDWFAVKEIDRRPDFDHIVRLRSGGPAKAKAIIVATPTLEPTSPSILNNALTQQLGVGWRGEQTLYFETDDLR